MEKINLRSVLEGAGYKITALMQGGFIAKKNQRVYKSESLQGLYNQILKPEW